MLSLTKQEKLSLLGLAVILGLGYALHFCLKAYPGLASILQFIEREEILYQIDVNTAVYEDLVQIPYIGDFTARKIIQKREALGAITSLRQIEEIPGVYPKNFEKFSPFLKVSYEEQ